MLVDLTLAEYDEAMYATELDYAKYPMVDYTDNSTTAAVLAVVATEKSYEVGDAIVVDVFVEWTMRRSGRKPDGYMVELSGRSGDYSNQARTEKTSCTFHNVKPGETYDIAVKCVFGEITIGSATTVIKVSASTKMPTVKPDKPQKLNIVMARRSVKAFWNEVTNTYIACYELRTNTAAGTPDGLLFQTKDIQAALELKERKGTLYLFAKNRIGQYSDPAEIAYEKPAPPAPKWVNAVARTGEIAITTESIPSDCLGVVVRAKGVKAEEKVVKSESPDILIAAEADIYAVRAAFYDQFGEGAEASAQREVAVKDKIDKDAIENLTVTQNDLDAALKKQLSDMQTTANAANTVAGNAANAAGAAQTAANDAVARVQQTQDSISSIVARLSGNPQNSGYSAITQLYNGLQLKVNQGEVVSAINVAPWGVRIDGRLLHVTGATQFDGNIIANHMLQAGAVTADKLSVGSLSAICATIGKLRTKATGARTEISDNLIEVFDDKNSVRVRIGVF